MNLFKRFYFIVPLLVLVIQIILLPSINFNQTVTPVSTKNTFQETLLSYLHIADFDINQLSVKDYDDEIEISLKNPDNTVSTIIFSTKKNPLIQVTALQKLTKIVNIKGKDIRFLDFTPVKPYATF